MAPRPDGGWCVAGDGGITTDLPAADAAAGAAGNSLSAALHETVIHAYGRIPHDLDREVPDHQHTGMGRNEDGNGSGRPPASTAA